MTDSQMEKNSGQTATYELLYIIANRFSENELKPIKEKVASLIADNGGEIAHEESWGKKRLAYRVKGEQFGYYELLHFDCAPAKIAELDRQLGLLLEIPRHLITVRKVKTAAEIEQNKKIAEKIAAKSDQEETAGKEKEKEKSKKKVDLKELDEKLEKILETNDLF